MGIAAVKKIVEREGLSGVFGSLIELFDCDEQLMTAVEVAAGGHLFDIVVDSDSTASHILEILNRDRIGRVTFIPLNQILVCLPFPFPFLLLNDGNRKTDTMDGMEWGKGSPARGDRRDGGDDETAQSIAI